MSRKKEFFFLPRTHRLRSEQAAAAAAKTTTTKTEPTPDGEGPWSALGGAIRDIKGDIALLRDQVIGAKEASLRASDIGAQKMEEM